MVGTTTQREQPCDEIVKGFERRLDTDPDQPMVVGPEHSVTAADIESVARNVASSLDQTTLPTASIVAPFWVSVSSWTWMPPKWPSTPRRRSSDVMYASSGAVCPLE